MKKLLIILLLPVICQAQVIKVPPSKDTVVINVVPTATATITYTTANIPVYVPPVQSLYFTLSKSDPIVLSGKSNLIIENKRISNAAGVAASLTNCSNITFRNCFFDGAALEAITLYGCKNIIIENCLFVRAETGIYASTSQTIVVRNNQFVNMRQRVTSTGRSRGQFVQFNTVTGSGNIIENNRGENFFGESDPEDQISCFKTSNTIIRGNMFRGGGPSKSGGGIVVGDYGGDRNTIENNQLVNPGNYGIAIAGGNYNNLIGNKVYSDFHDWNNAGVIIWAQGGVAGSNATFVNNRINWPYKLGGQNNVFINGNISVAKNSGNVYNEKFETMMPDFPEHLIDFVTPDELLKIRK